MDIVVLFNGLGNQMSQYAFFLAKKKYNSNCHVIFDPISVCNHNGFELERVFGIKIHKSYFDEVLSYFYGYVVNRRIIHRLLKLIGIRIIKEPQNYDYHKELLNTHCQGINFYWGGWHSEKYFISIENEIKCIFKIPPVFDSSAYNDWLNIISTDDGSISIHVRRGDYLDESPDSYYQFNGVCTIDYYCKAILYIKERLSKTNFYVFSNDIDWCMSFFGTENMHYVNCNSGKDSWRDMFLMSECRHHINANSTFSWWAAWLSPYSDGIVIRPNYFIKDVETKDFYPSEWIVIE